MVVCLRAYLSVCLGSDYVLDPTTEQGRLADRQCKQGRWEGRVAREKTRASGTGGKGVLSRKSKMEVSSEW